MLRGRRLVRSCRRRSLVICQAFHHLRSPTLPMRFFHSLLPLLSSLCVRAMTASRTMGPTISSSPRAGNLLSSSMRGMTLGIVSSSRFHSMPANTSSVGDRVFAALVLPDRILPRPRLRLRAELVFCGCCCCGTALKASILSMVSSWIVFHVFSTSAHFSSVSP